MSTALEHVCNILDLSDKAKRERELFAQKIVALASAKPRSYGTACCERLLMAKAYGRRRSLVSLEAGRRATHRAASLAASPRSTCGSRSLALPRSSPASAALRDKARDPFSGSPSSEHEAGDAAGEVKMSLEMSPSALQARSGGADDRRPVA